MIPLSMPKILHCSMLGFFANCEINGGNLMPVRFEIGTKSGKTYKKDVEANKIGSLMNTKIGQEFDGGVIDLPGFKLKLTGGSDKEGFPMRSGVSGQRRTKILISGGVGYKTIIGEGVRRRKSIRGEVLSADIQQINCMVVKEGKQTIEEALGIKPKEEPKA